jgi:hypothetical protein
MIQVFDNLISLDCVKKLQDEFNARPYVKDQYTNSLYGKVLQFRNKNLNYQLPDDPVHALLFPVVNQIFGQCDLQNGAFLESHFPFSLHVDTAEVFKRNQFYSTGKQNLGHALLIPLSEHECFQTVFFDWHSPTLPNLPMYDGEKPLITSNFPNLDHLTLAARNFLSDKPLSKSITWKLGSGIIWPRDQLHCSSNFYPTGMCKLAVVMFF